MKDIKKEKVKREVFRSDNGFEFVRESESHSLYEHKSGFYKDDIYDSVDNPENDPKFEQTGGGATAKEEKIVTPKGKELETLREVFDWLDSNYVSQENNKFKKSEPVVKTREELDQVNEEEGSGYGNF